MRSQHNTKTDRFQIRTVFAAAVLVSTVALGGCLMSDGSDAIDSLETAQDGLSGPIGPAPVLERSFIFRGAVFSQDTYEVDVLMLNQLYRTCATIGSTDVIRSMDGDQRGALYLAEEASGVAVVDINDPCAAFEANRLAPSPGAKSMRLQVAPNRLFVTEADRVGATNSTEWHLRVYDATSATAPQLLDTIVLGYTDGGSALGTIVPINSRYVAVQLDNYSPVYPPIPSVHGTHIVDLQTRTIVHRIGALSATPNMWVYGRYLYAAVPVHGSLGNLKIWDMVNPASPVALGSVPYDGATSDWRTLTMVDQGTRKLAVFVMEASYGAEGPGSMVVVDVSNPNAPFYVTDSALEEVPGGIYVLGGDADGIGNQVHIWGWTPNRGQGYDYYLITYDLTDPENPVRQRFTHLPMLLSAD